MTFTPISNGITVTDTQNYPSIIFYRVDNTYFYDASYLKLVITGAQWLLKDLEQTYIKLATGEAAPLSDGIIFESAPRVEDRWVILFSENNYTANQVENLYYDSADNEYKNYFFLCRLRETYDEGEISYFYGGLPLKDYPHDEVWLCPQYSHDWPTETDIVITVP